MTAIVGCADSKPRAKLRSWAADVSGKPLFREQITIDQCEVEDAWVRLSVNTSVVEFHEMPVRLHRSLVKAIKRSMSKEETP